MSKASTRAIGGGHVLLTHNGARSSHMSFDAQVLQRTCLDLSAVRRFECFVAWMVKTRVGWRWFGVFTKIPGGRGGRCTLFRGLHYAHCAVDRCTMSSLRSGLAVVEHVLYGRGATAVRCTLYVTTDPPSDTGFGICGICARFARPFPTAAMPLQTRVSARWL